tara:strand:- start:832 stop:1098 length:267 start_codon:yes stop_codon:yes gene_type:complete
MIELLRFIEDLKEIRDTMPYTNLTKTVVDDKIEKYQKQIDEFDKWAETQSEQEPFLVTGLKEKTTSELLHEGFIEEQKQREKEEEEDK